MRFVSYFRVSTARQGQSGLGLDAQRHAVEQFCKDGEIVAEFTDIESGKRDDRPELAKALALAKKLKAKLVIAKLDRLSRGSTFVNTLLDAGVDFVACDNPHANPLTIRILAAVAQHEREQISARTKAALAAAKARGTVLGNPHPIESLKRASAARSDAAAQRAANVLPVIESIRERVRSMRAIAAELNARGVPAPRGGSWQAVQVQRVLGRAGSL